MRSQNLSFVPLENLVLELANHSVKTGIAVSILFEIVHLLTDAEKVLFLRVIRTLRNSCAPTEVQVRNRLDTKGSVKVNGINDREILGEVVLSNTLLKTDSADPILPNRVEALISLKEDIVTVHSDGEFAQPESSS